jgi:large subunit ribosomal protein L13Ae
VNCKTARGAAAFANVKVFEGVRPRYANSPKPVVPTALCIVAISGDRPVTSLGEVATTFDESRAASSRSREGQAEEKYKNRSAAAKKKLGAVKAATVQLGKVGVKLLNPYVE